MAVDWRLGGGGFDAMESLQAFGAGQQQLAAQQQRERQMAEQQRLLAARQQAAGQLGGGDYQGATQTALQNGDFDLAKHIGGLREDHQKQMAAQADVLGRAAFGLRNVPAEQRAARLQQLAPSLSAAGITPEELAHADLSDEGLDGYISLSQDISKQLGNMLTQARVADVATDNARSDNLAQNTIASTQARLALARNGDARDNARLGLARQARGEASVRFRERDKDRAAVAAGGRGMNTSTDDLNY